MKTKIESYFHTLTDAVNEAQMALDNYSAVLVFSGVQCSPDAHWTQQIFDAGHIAYGYTKTFNFEVSEFNGKPTRKWFHIAIHRTENGRYELSTYFL